MKIKHTFTASVVLDSKNVHKDSNKETTKGCGRAVHKSYTH